MFEAITTGAAKAATGGWQSKPRDTHRNSKEKMHYV